MTRKEKIKESLKGFKTKQFGIYFGRWQISAYVMLPIMLILEMFGMPLWLNLMIGQAFGSVIFWEIDKLIFNNHKKDNIEDTIEVMVSQRKL